MKNCRHYRQHWLAYFLGELDPDRQKMMAEHLAHCQRCQKELNEIKDVIGRTEDWKSELGKTMADIDWDRLQVAITDNVFRQKESQSAAGTAATLKHRHWQPALAGLVAGLLLGMFLVISFCGQKDGPSRPAGEIQRLIYQLALSREWIWLWLREKHWITWSAASIYFWNFFRLKVPTSFCSPDPGQNTKVINREKISE